MVPPARRPPDRPRHLAPVAPARRHVAPSHPPPADTLPPQTRATAPQATSARASPTTRVPKNATLKLAPMGAGRDPLANIRNAAEWVSACAGTAMRGGTIVKGSNSEHWPPSVL